MGPGFTADEPLEELGQHLSLPPDFEHLRDRLGGVLTPLPDPRTERTGTPNA
jgi:glyoxalase family protein